MFGSRLGRILPLLALALACGPDEPPPPVEFVVGEVVTNPTAHGIEIALLPQEAVELYASFMEVGGASPATTPRVLSPARELVVLKLAGLEPDREYDYSIWTRRPGEKEFRERAGSRVRTLRRQADAVFKFAYAADSHIVGRFIKAQCGFGEGQRLALANFRATVGNVLDSDVDFIVAGGDTFMIHAPRLKTCSPFESLGAGTARDARQADLRYELALSSVLWGRLVGRVPFLYVLGNHDGEAHFGDLEGSFGHFADTRAIARAARLRHLPDPIVTYGNGAGGRDGDLYYAFTSGDALFVVLDVMAGPRDYPMQPDDWTLGAHQLRWFKRVLTRNDRTWTIVFAEHLVGGVVSPAPATETMTHYDAYGRGGLRATRDGTPRAPFSGEQAALQALMRTHGVDVFFHAHDHVAVAGEKQSADGTGEGVTYVLGGQASGDGSGPSWQDQTWFREAFDYDGDGVADFLNPTTGSLAPGFYRVTVSGARRLHIEYVASDAEDPAANAKVAFRLSLVSDGAASSDSAR